MRDHDFAAAIRDRAKKLASATANFISEPMPDGSPVVTVHQRSELVAVLTLIFNAVLSNPAELLHGEQPRCRKCGGTREVPAGDGVGDVFECPDCQ